MTKEKAHPIIPSIMLRIKGQVILFALAVFGLLLVARPSLATVRCTTQYGGGEICEETADIVLDKKVWDEERKIFEDNLADITSEGFKFSLGDRVIYRVRVTNVSDRKFDKVTITDTFPTANYLKYDTTNASSPKFEYRDGKVAKVSFDLFDLGPGEWDEKQIELLVVRTPAQNTFDCKVINEVEAWAEDQYARDTAKICVTSREKVLGVTILPKTGSPVQFLLILTSLFAGLIGLALIRLNRKP